MITCARCGHENEESAVDCADCGINLEWAMRDADEAGPDHRAGSEQLTSIADQQPVTESKPISLDAYVLWAGIGILGTVIGYLLGTQAPHQGHYAGENWMFICIFSIPVIPVLGTGVGIGVGWLAHRRLRRAYGHNVTIGLATVCAAIITIILGYTIVAIGLWAIDTGRFP